MVSLDFLEKVDILKDLDDDQLTAILDCSHEAEYSRGDRMFGVSEDPEYLYVIMEGEVDLTRGERWSREPSDTSHYMRQ